MRKFHSLLIRVIQHLNLRHGEDRVWVFKRIPLGNYWDAPAGLNQGQKTLQAKPSAFDRVNARRLFLRLERQSFIARWPGWGHVVNTPQFIFGWRFILADSQETEPGRDIVSSPWGGNIGWPKLTDNAAMRIFQEKFFRQFSGQHPGWWADELPFFPFSASFSSTEDLELQLEVNGI